MADPTQVDWSYQIQGIPPFGGGTFAGVNPPVGPFAGPVLVIDQSTGAVLTAGPHLAFLLASLTNPGMVSDTGGQQLQGPFFLAPLAGALAPPTLPVFAWSLALQNGSLILTHDADGSPPSPFAELTWERFSAIQHTLTLGSGGGLILQSGSEPTATCTMVGPISGQLITQDQPPNYTQIVDPDRVGLFGGASAVAILTGNSGLNTCWLDLSTATAGQVWYQISGVPGIGGTFAGGLTVQGGIVTGIGAPSLPWSDLTGTPSTLVGYGIPSPLDVSEGGTGGNVFTPYAVVCGGTVPAGPLQEVVGLGVLGEVLTSQGPATLPAWLAPAGGLAIGEPIAGGTAREVLYVDSVPSLAQSANILIDDGAPLFSCAYPFSVANHASVARAPFSVDLCNTTALTASDGVDQALLATGGVAGQFTDGTNTVILADGTRAIRVVAGMVMVGGAAGNTYGWFAGAAAPTPQAVLGLPLSVYGAGVISHVLGDPDSWALVQIGATQYRLPLYL